MNSFSFALGAALVIAVLAPARAQEAPDGRGVSGGGKSTAGTVGGGDGAEGAGGVTDGDKRVYTTRRKTTTQQSSGTMGGSPRHHETPTTTGSQTDYTDYFDREAGTPGGERERRAVEPDRTSRERSVRTDTVKTETSGRPEGTNDSWKYEPHQGPPEVNGEGEPDGAD